MESNNQSNDIWVHFEEEMICIGLCCMMCRVEVGEGIISEKLDDEDVKDEEIEGERQDQESNDINEERSESESNKSEQIANSNQDKESNEDEPEQERNREDIPSSRKCFNKMCSSKKIYKKIRSRVEENKYRFFCKNCYENYYNNSYCEFCEQIYSSNYENEDDDKWIGCDSCERWNHLECEKKYRDKNIVDLKDKNVLYECLVCTQKSKSNQPDKNKPHKDKDNGFDEKPSLKPKFQISKDQRTLIFHKKLENFPNLEYFLQNYSFRLWINEGLIREDIEQLRNISSKSVSSEEIMKNKFKKVKINE